MKNNVTLKIAVSSLILATGTIGCKPVASNHRPATLSAKAHKSDQGAVKLHYKAGDAVGRGNYAEALALMENAVALAPTDVGYRMTLADLYVKNGRFIAAETSFSDVLTLNPGNERAALNLALVKIALGKGHAATLLLDHLAETAAPGDVGLAFALAGQPQRAIEMLEPAARAPGADGRVRQNLALAYALAGDWQKARTTAAQDVSPADLDDRIRQWAEFVQPSQSWTQVASLLGVTPVEDSGQPVRLALAPAPSPEAAAFAQAEAPPPVVAAPPPVELAVAPAPAPEPVIQSEAAFAQPVYAEAVQSLVEAPAEMIRASVPGTEVPLPAFVPVKKASGIAGQAPRRVAAAAGPGRFVVQLGAFKSASQVETAWERNHHRFRLVSHQPLSTTVSIPGRGVFHRLSVSGFGTQNEAARLCGSIRAKGGACFVRPTAGDAPVRWASRASRRA